MGARTGNGLCLVGAVAGGVGEQRGGEFRVPCRIGTVLLPKPVIDRGADGVVPSGVGWCRTASDDAQELPPTSNYSYLRWSELPKPLSRRRAP